MFLVSETPLEPTEKKFIVTAPFGMSRDEYIAKFLSNTPHDVKSYNYTSN